jgi:outer membrane protein assembly factor BamD
MNVNKLLSILMISTILISCSSKKKGDEAIRPPEEIYNTAMDQMEDDKYKKAIENFEELERTYPYSKWAIKAEIMSAYTNFKNEDYTSAIVILDKFIGLHPGNKDIGYAYYLKALCYYQQISDIERDQGYSSLSLTALREVIARFPESAYARDAQGKIDLVLDHLAGKEVDVGRFYLKQGKYIAAINRFKEVIDKYQTTAHVPEALHRLVEANMALGLKNEAQKYASVLGYNYPGSKWYEYSYELIEGKKPDVDSEGRFSKFVGFVKNPLKKLRSQPNLADSVDKNVYDLGPGEEKPSKVLPLKIQPVGRDRSVKIGEITEGSPKAENNGNHNMLHQLGSWFKNLKMPFSGREK